MYDDGMIRMETQTENGKMAKNGAVIVNRFMWAKRADGRDFAGQIESVRALPKGTLVVVSSWDTEWDQRSHKSFYLESLVEWEVCEDADTFDTLFNDPWRGVPAY